MPDTETKTPEQWLQTISKAAGNSVYAQSLVQEIENFPAKNFPIDGNSIKYWLYEKLAYKKDWLANHEKAGEKAKAAQDKEDIQILENCLKVFE